MPQRMETDESPFARPVLPRGRRLNARRPENTFHAFRKGVWTVWALEKRLPGVVERERRLCILKLLEPTLHAFKLARERLQPFGLILELEWCDKLGELGLGLPSFVSYARAKDLARKSCAPSQKSSGFKEIRIFYSSPAPPCPFNPER